MLPVKPNNQMSNLKLQYKDIYLKPVTKEHIQKGWAKWLRDPDINLYIKNKKNINKRYLEKYLKKNHILFLACYCSKSKKYFGNLRIYLLSKNTFSFGRLIGEKNFINKGYGTKLALIAQDICFNWLNAKEIIVGNHKANQNSILSKKKTGFKKINLQKIIKFKLNLNKKYEFYSITKTQYTKL